MLPAQYALAIDFGGTKVEAGLVEANGTPLEASRFRAPTGPTATSAELSASTIRVAVDALKNLPAGATLLGVGIGCAGPVSLEHGLVSPLNVTAWRDFPLRDLIADAVPDVPVVLRIDGSCLALAEHWVGAAQGAANLMGIVVSTGIGGGLILQNRLIEGESGNAGHIGHVEVGGFDERCACGGIGCVEAVASGPKTVAWAQSQGFTGTTGEELSAAYASGDSIAARAIERSGRAIGQAIASATALLDVEVVAISGGFSRVTPDLFIHMRKAIADRAEFRFVANVRVVPSTLSDAGPLIGAAALIHRAQFVFNEPSAGDHRPGEDGRQRRAQQEE
jgi:glucokinase